MTEFNSELGDLRKIVPLIQITPPVIQESSLYPVQVVRLETQDRACISREAIGDLISLSKALFKRSPDFSRLVTQDEFRGMLGEAVIKKFAGVVRVLSHQDVADLFSTLENLVKGHAVPHKVYVPCIFGLYPYAPFSIGPIRFEFGGTYGLPSNNISSPSFEYLLKLMAAEEAFTMAVVDIPGGSNIRAENLADTAVDLAFAALQAFAPLWMFDGISRLYARRHPVKKITVIQANGSFSTSSSNLHPSLSVGPGLLEDVLAQGAKLVTSSGKRIEKYLNGEKDLPLLETAWCDSAYWFHQALAEPMDALAVTKLVASYEILFRATSSSKINTLSPKIVKTFFNLKMDQELFQNPSIEAQAFVDDVIENRSRVLHGDWSTLTMGHRDNRQHATLFMKVLLVEYSLALDDYYSETGKLDRIDAFLDWIDNRRNPKAL